MSVTLKDVGSGYKRTAINSNFEAIEAEINNNLLSKNGGVGLEADLDANSQKIINLADGVLNQDAVTVGQLSGAIAAAGSGLIASQKEVQTGADVVGNVTTFTGITYTVAGNNLFVFRNGNFQTLGVDYTETSSSSITWTVAPNSTDGLTFITNLSTTNSTTDTSAITHVENSTNYNLATYLQNRHLYNVTDDEAVGDGLTNNGTIQEKLVNIPGGNFVFDETNFLVNNVNISGVGKLINNTPDTHVIAVGEKQSGANTKYEYAKISNITLSDSSIHTDDNWATVNSSSDYTEYSNLTVEDSYVGLSFNVNYNYTDTPSDRGVDAGVITGNIVNARFMGIEHFATRACATSGNALFSTTKAGPGFRFTGDDIVNSYGNGTNAAHGFSNGLTIQTYTRANNLTGYAITNCTNGFSIPKNSTYTTGSSRNNIVELTADNVTNGFIVENLQYNWIRGSVDNATSYGFREIDSTGSGGYGDLKSNKVDLLLTNCAAGAILESSHTEVTINASDIEFSCLTINGDHNNVKLICDKANTVATTNRALVLNGTHNLVEVISTGNTAIGASGDVLIAGNKNDVRVMTDATVRLEGDNNAVRGFAASTVDVGTGNDVTGISTY